MSINASKISSTPNLGNVERSSRQTNAADALGFRSELQALQNPNREPAGAPAASSLRFSNHAVERMQTRGLQFSAPEMEKMQSAVDRAAAKGSRNCLLLTDSAALIVSVKDNTVVTVMDKTALKENVFTNIDSTVVC